MTPHRARHLTTIPDLAELNGECQHAPPKFEPPHPCAIVYGKGELGRMAIDYLETIGHAALKWIDQSDLTDDMFPILSPEALIAQRAKPQRFLTLVAVAKHPYVPIEQDLLARGFRHVAPFLDVTPNHPEHPLANGWFAAPLDLDKVQTVLDMFADDVSRAHYVQFLAWRRLREEWTFEGAPVDVDGPRYWPTEVASVLHDHEVFVDGGAHTGRTSVAFAALVDYTYKMIVAVEPDPTSQRALFNRLNPGPNTMIVRHPLGERWSSQIFHDGMGYASRLSDTGNLPLRVGPLDDIGIDGPTFIKLHLEGAELAALEGAAWIVTNRRPILAVTTYHNDDGIDRIPLWLRDHCPDYRFLWRNSAYVGEGAVMFAIPNERN